MTNRASIMVILVACLAGSVSAQEPSASSERDRLYSALAQEAKALERHSGLIKKVVRVVKPTVVHIDAKKLSRGSVQYGGRKTYEEAGSGIIVKLNRKYYVVTNRHVIHSAPMENIEIQLSDGRKLNPTKVVSDPGTDVAVMSISAAGLVATRIGDSDKIEIGDFVIALGSPFGLSHSVSYGIISAKGRRDLELGVDGVRYQDFLQTDAAINPGNSGGPLMNLRGELIGINTAIASNSGGNEGIGFTIPVNMVMAVARQLADTGKVRRAFLGVHLDSKFTVEETIELGLPRPTGARITGVIPNSPADDAGLVEDDVILKFNDTRVEDDTHLVNLVSLTPIGTEVSVVIFRDAKPVSMKLKVDDHTKYASRG